MTPYCHKDRMLAMRPLGASPTAGDRRADVRKPPSSPRRGRGAANSTSVAAMDPQRHLFDPAAAESGWQGPPPQTEKRKTWSEAASSDAGRAATSQAIIRELYHANVVASSR